MEPLLAPKKSDKFALTKSLVVPILIILVPLGFLEINKFLEFKANQEAPSVSKCASALAGLKTAQEIFMTDHVRYANSLSELTNFKGRIYINGSKVKAVCKNPKIKTKGDGFVITATVTNKFGTCKLIYTETRSITKGDCQ